MHDHYHQSHQGWHKASAACRLLQQQQPSVELDVITTELDDAHLHDIAAMHDLVIDCYPSPLQSEQLRRVCSAYAIPLLFHVYDAEHQQYYVGLSSQQQPLPHFLLQFVENSACVEVIEHLCFQSILVGYQVAQAVRFLSGQQVESTAFMLNSQRCCIIDVYKISSILRKD